VAVKHLINWIYGAAVAMEGRVMTILPGRTPCLRCVFPEPPSPGELPTCDTAGVLGPVSTIVGSLQATAAIKLMTEQENAIANELLTLDLWDNRIRPISLNGARRRNCVCCGLHRYEFLDAKTNSATSLCGREAIQIRSGRHGLKLDELERQLERNGQVTRTPYFLRIRLLDPKEIELIVFPDGRTIVKGTTDAGRARAIFSRFVGD
jgi:molybdopterin-synthase adenylyltransferase